MNMKISQSIDNKKLLPLAVSPIEAAHLLGIGRSRLACFCSAMGIEPSEVGSDALLGLYEALETEEVIKNPRKIVQHTIGHWNMCRRQICGWPPIKLTSPFPSKRYMLSLTQFSKIFQADLGIWCRRLLDPDVLADDGPGKALQTVTVKHQEKVIPLCFRFDRRGRP